MSFIVFSACKSGLPKEENIDRDAALRLGLSIRNIRFHRVVGAHEGARENSVIVHQDNIDIARELASQYDQGTILVVDENRNAQVQKLDGTVVAKGAWVRKPHHEALGAQDFTFDPVTGNYYIVRWVK